MKTSRVKLVFISFLIGVLLTQTFQLPFIGILSLIIASPILFTGVFPELASNSSHVEYSFAWMTFKTMRPWYIFVTYFFILQNIPYQLFPRFFADMYNSKPAKIIFVFLCSFFLFIKLVNGFNSWFY